MIDLIYYRRPTLIGRFDELLDELAESGINTLCLAQTMGDLSLFRADDVARAKVALAERGIAAPAMHGLFRGKYDLNASDLNYLLSGHTTVMTHGAELGAKTYVVHAGLPIAGRSEAEEWTAVRRSLDALIPIAQSRDVVVALENLPPNYVGHRPTDLMAMVDAFDTPHLRLCFDSGHAHMCGDAAEYLDAMAPAVVTMHLHDNDGTADRHLSPGHGTIDWQRLVPAIRRCPSPMHLEIESFNREGFSHTELIEMYRELDIERSTHMVGHEFK